MVMLKENRNMCKGRGTKKHTLSGQVPPHPIQSKNKIYIYEGQSISNETFLITQVCNDW